MSRFATLLQREWLQHHRGYLALTVAPPVLLLVVLAFTRQVQVEPSFPEAVMAGALAAVTALVLALGWIAMAFQLPGLARRDQQDRSIEFWLSLPVGHAQSVGATLLFHALLMPLLALALGWLLSHVVGLTLVAIVGGASAWFELPWGLLMTDSAVLLLRLALGVCLATLWVSPVLLVLMLASAGLKRWGVPAIAALLTVAALVLDKAYGITWVSDAAGFLFQQAAAALSPLGLPPQQLPHGESIEGLEALLRAFPALSARSALDALRALASPAFLATMAASAACFGGLVALRRRNG